jgi:hypothetical protein
MLDRPADAKLRADRARQRRAARTRTYRRPLKAAARQKLSRARPKRGCRVLRAETHECPLG